MTLDPAAQAKMELDERLNQIGGCSDGNCIVVKRKGQHTNGGCRCLTNAFNAQRVVYAYKQFVQKVTA